MKAKDIVHGIIGLILLAIGFYITLFPIDMVLIFFGGYMAGYYFSKSFYKDG